MKKHFLWALISVLAFASCDHRCSDLVLDVGQPMNLRELSVETEAGQKLWSFKANGQPLSRVRYGELPPGGEQLFPENHATPRQFVTHERLVVRTFEKDWFFFIHGFAREPKVFCGGYTEGGPVKSLQEHERSISAGNAARR